MQKRQEKEERTTRTLREIAVKCARIADSKKAQDVVVLNVSRVFLIADYFVICSCDSSVQAKSIASEVEEELGKLGVQMIGKEGVEDSRWILLDFGSIVMHIFREEARRFYAIEHLWGDARTIKWAPPRKQKVEFA